MSIPRASEYEIIDTLRQIRSVSTSQDPLDAMADELRVSKCMHKYAEKRKKDAETAITSLLTDKIAETKLAAANTLMKREYVAHSTDFSIVIACNAPAMRVDATAFRNELIKAGVKLDIVNAAYKAATKAASPATSINAIEKE